MILSVRVMMAGVYPSKSEMGVHRFQQVYKPLGARKNHFYFIEGERDELHSSVAVVR